VSILRIGGIASGFDTEQIIRDLMRVERMRVDKTFQQRQVFQWQKEQYRAMTNKIRSFRDTYFDILKPETNIMSAARLKKMTSVSGDPTLVSVTAHADAALGVSTFQVIQSAEAAKAQASAVTINSADGERLSLSDTMETISGKLQHGDFVFNEEGTFALTINDKQISVHKNDTLRTVLSRINGSDAGVQVSYSSFSDTFTFTNKATGDKSITTDNGGNFFAALGLNPNEQGEIGQAGRNAIFEIDGFRGERATNSFTIDGITYSINQKVDGADNSPIVQITTAVDSNAIYETIEKFINDYNQLIDDIGAKLKEERFSAFLPLTDEQKETMSEKDIDKWEEMAQSGLLRRDSALENMLQGMRTALYDAVGSDQLAAIGIRTSSNYLEGGKLVLRDGGSALRAAIEENPDRVVDLFTRRSEIDYSPNLSAEARAQRHRESGLAHRLSDILNDNIRTTRDNSGRKGILLERAGIEGDTTEFNNRFSKQIDQVNKRIDIINATLKRKEDQYYRQFTAMEKALQQLYSQGDWLMSQLQYNMN
jgi:flagellar hook-associated protein 2